MDHFFAPSFETKFLSFSDMTIKCDDQAFNLLRNGWPYNRLDYLHSWSVLLLDVNYRANGILDFPLKQKMVTEKDAQHIVAHLARANVSSFILAHNKQYGVLSPTSQDRAFIKLLYEAVKEEDKTLIDCFLINKQGYYSYNENEHRICISAYAL